MSFQMMNTQYQCSLAKTHTHFWKQTRCSSTKQYKKHWDKPETSYTGLGDTNTYTIAISISHD